MTSFNHSFADAPSGADCPSCHAAQVLPQKSREKMRLYPERWQANACMALKSQSGPFTVCTHFLHCERRVVGGRNEWYETVIFAERMSPARPPYREWLDFRRGYATRELAEFGHEQVLRMVESGSVNR